MVFQTQRKLPLIDFSKGNLNPNTSYWDSTSDKVRKAFEDYGCFVAKYDDISVELENKMLKVVKDVFEISEKGPNAIQDPTLNWFRKPGKPSMEGFLFPNITTVDGTKKLTHALWPQGNIDFSDTVLSYTKLASKLEQTIMKMVCQSYGVEKCFDSDVDPMTYNLGLLKYGPTQDSILGFQPHTDKCFITLLFSNSNGLEVETKDKEWIAYEKAPLHFIVMVGDAFRGWSNGRIHSPTHRVIYGGDENRYTIKVDTYTHDLVTIPPELVDDDHPLQFKPFSNFEYLEYCKTTGSKEVDPLKSYCGV